MGDKIETTIDILIKELKIHNRLYHVEDNPMITDYEYDMMYTELERLESEYPEFIREDSPTQTVGG